MPAIGKDVAEFELEEIFIFVDVEGVACIIEGPYLGGVVGLVLLFDHGLCM
jgi:hypothetical protein